MQRNKSRNVSAEGRPASSAPTRTLVVTVVAVGGAAGALARFGVSALWPNGTDAHLMWQQGAAAFPWTTLVINVGGCFCMGALVSSSRNWPAAPPWFSAFLGTGVLGGFTTFSTYTDDTRRLFENDQPWSAVGYLLLTPAAAMAGVVLGWICAAVLRRRPPGRNETR